MHEALLEDAPLSIESVPIDAAPVETAVAAVRQKSHRCANCPMNKLCCKRKKDDARTLSEVLDDIPPNWGREDLKTREECADDREYWSQFFPAVEPEIPVEYWRMAFGITRRERANRSAIRKALDFLAGK